jgi:hypothetical protein
MSPRGGCSSRTGCGGRTGGAGEESEGAARVERVQVMVAAERASSVVDCIVQTYGSAVMGSDGTGSHPCSRRTVCRDRTPPYVLQVPHVLFNYC